MPFICTVQHGSFIQLRIHGHDCSDEQYHVLSEITPYRGSNQREVVNTLVFEPVRKIVQLESTPLENGIEYEPSGVEELKDKSNGNTVNQEREEHKSLE